MGCRRRQSSGNGSPDGPLGAALYPIRVYAFFAEGVYAYDAKANKLVRVAEGDRRKLAGMQDFVFTAPLNLVYVADLAVYEGKNIPAEHTRYLCGQDAAAMPRTSTSTPQVTACARSRAAAPPKWS